MQAIQYDYLGHVPINLFYKLKFYFDAQEKDSYFYCQRGIYRKFKTGDEVPTKTLYYKYPKNFYVVTYGSDSMALHIKDGKYVGILDIEKDFIIDNPIYDIWGNKLKVETILDIKVIKIEYERLKSKELEVNKFISLWIDNPYVSPELIVFGRYIEIFRDLHQQKNEEYCVLKKLFREFLEKQEIDKLIESYKEWLEDEDLILHNDIAKIVAITMEDAI